MRLDNGRLKVKMAIVYMPQENDISIGDLQKIYNGIEKEVLETRGKKESILIMGDFNCKVGNEIEGNNSEVTKGGKLLLELCRNTGMVIMNANEKCRGKWTRSQGTERSIIDYVLIWKDDLQSLKSMEIDENKDYTPYSTYSNTITYSDHNTMEISLDWIQKKIEEASLNILERVDYEKYELAIQESNISQIIDSENLKKMSFKGLEKRLRNIFYNLLL